MNYKAGDKVRVVSQPTKNWVDSMNEYLGKIVTIKKVEKDDIGVYYKIEEDRGWYSWHNYMMEQPLIMYVGENRTIENNKYKIHWLYGMDYKKDDCSKLLILDVNNKLIFDIQFTYNNYKQQITISNIIMSNLGINIILQERSTDFSTMKRGTMTNKGTFYDYVVETKQVLVMDGMVKVYDESEVELKEIP